MTINSETCSVEYSGNGVTDTFAYSWKIAAKTHLSVVLVADSDGSRTTPTIDVDYTVTGVGATGGGNIVFDTPPASGLTVVIDSAVPYTQTTDLRNQGDYYPETVENRFDQTVRQIQQVRRDQLASLQIPSGTDDYDAGGLRITDLGDPVDEGDAVNLGTLDDYITALGSGIAGTAAAYATGTGDGSEVNLSFPGITVSTAGAYIVAVGGVIQTPTTDYTVDVLNEQIVFTTAPGVGDAILAVCFGYQRAVNEIGSNAVGTSAIQDDAVSFAKMQNIATDTLLGRSTPGTGNVETITLTAAGRALLDDANAAAQRTTLGLGTIATQDASAVSITGGTLSAVTISGVSLTGGTIGAGVTLAGLTYAALYALLPTGAPVGYGRDFDTTRGSIASGSITPFPIDGTTPLITEGGDTGLSLSYAAYTTTNKLLVELVLHVDFPAVNTCGIAIFADSTCIGSVPVGQVAAAMNGTVTISAEYTPGSTSAKTYTARVSLGSNTALINQSSASANLGTTHGSSITIREFKA